MMTPPIHDPAFVMAAGMVISLLVSIMARASIYRTSQGQSLLSLRLAFTFSAIPTIGIGLVALMSSLDHLQIVLAMSLCCFLAAAAIGDRETGWAPPAMTLPTVLLAGLFGQQMGFWEYGPLTVVGLSFVLWIFCELFWVLLSRVVDLPPPPDLMAFALPVLFFPDLVTCAAFYILISLLLLICMKIPSLAIFFSKEEVVSDVACEIGVDIEDLQGSITFLFLTGPVTILFLAAIVAGIR